VAVADATIVQCNACGGIYRPLQADGTRYFHTCPTRRVVDVVPAPTKDNLDATQPVFAPIANRRDENVAGVDDDGKAVMKSEGLGVTPVTDPAVVATLTGAEDAP
jgi:hypothetical protein